MIPQVFHTFWVQGPPLPDTHQEWFDSWTVHNPDWEHVLWSEADYMPLVEEGPNADIYETAVNHAQRAEIARWDVLYRHGGVVLDADFECLRPWDFLDGIECFAPYEGSGWLTMSCLGAAPQHPAVRDIRQKVTESILAQRAAGLDQTWGAGPKLVQREWLHRPDVAKLEEGMLFPYQWDEPDPGVYGDAYAVHHWTASWKGD